ncbi:hypothetical protein [Halorubrum sp. HHNYT27]|uniref:hypothetical protein n=1 Tax=Halorubrum sp. HHNYT27 TaxID=3402275 RepID=UPI003EB9B4BB
MVLEPTGLGWSLKGRIALGVWGLAVLAVLSFAFDVLGITGVELAVVGVVVAAGSFYGIFMPLWRRLPEDARRS